MRSGVVWRSTPCPICGVLVVYPENRTEPLEQHWQQWHPRRWRAMVEGRAVKG